MTTFEAITKSKEALAEFLKQFNIESVPFIIYSGVVRRTFTIYQYIHVDFLSY